MQKNAKQASRTHGSALLSVVILMVLLVIALVPPMGSDYAEALMPDKAATRSTFVAKSPANVPNGTKAVVKQATSKRGTIKRASTTGVVSERADESTPTMEAPRSDDESLHTLTHTILSEEGKELYVVSVTFGDDAGVPYNTELQVTENPVDDGRAEALRQARELTDDQKSFFDTMLDVRLVADGMDVELAAPVEVEIATTVIEPSDSYAIEVAHMDEEGATSLPVEVLTGVDVNGEPIEKPGFTRLKVRTDKVGEFALSKVLEKKYVWPMDNEAIAIWGPRAASTDFTETIVDEEYADGLTMLRRIGAHVDPSNEWAPNLWVSAELAEGVEPGLGGVRCYTMKDGKLDVELFGTAGSDQPVIMPFGAEYAFLWDDGYRTTTAEAGSVTFFGKLPLDVEAWAEDVSGNYSDADALLGTKDETSFGYRTVAAFNASFLAQGKSWEPDAEHAVTATVADGGISEKTNLQVWHVDDAGELARIADVDLSDGAASFAMNDAGIYILVKRVSYVRELVATDGATYKVTVTYDKSAGLPNNVELVVNEVERGTASYFDYATQSTRILGVKSQDVSYVKALDIELVDTVTGMKYQPSDNVKVRVEPLEADLAQSENVDVVHFGTWPEVMSAELDGGDVVFEADGFSVYVLCAYTVDFHWGDYTYSIAGESETTLSSVLEKLGVTEIAIADVTNVSFSNPEYLDIEQTDSDWVLTSRAPFSTEETLTLALVNGQSVDIRLTDDSTVVGSWPCNQSANDDVTCTLYDNGDMVISGKGAMIDYKVSPWVKDTPWYKDHVMDLIQRVVVTDGITHLGTNTFTRAGALVEIDASQCSTLINAGTDLFKVDSGKSYLTRVDVSGNTNFTGFGDRAFQDVNTIQYLDISNTKMDSITIFDASNNKIETLNAAGCTNLTSLTVPSKVKSLDVSGCTSLANLTVPSGVTSLDVSGCTGLTTLDISGCDGIDSLDLSSCANLTTVKVGNRSDQADLSWLTLPDSVTTLDASGFTSLNTVSVPESVTNLNLSGCTGLVTLTVPSGVTTLDVSDCTALTALKLHSSVVSLNVTGCPKLVIYYDGTAASLQEDLVPSDVPLVSWADYTYSIQRNDSVPLDEILIACGITGFTSADVQDVSVSDSETLQVTPATGDTAATITNLKPFEGSQTLTLVLENGISGTIQVLLAPLTESSDLNTFIDDGTAYKYAGGTNTHPLAEYATVKAEDNLQLNLSFSEIPEGQDGERQMKLLEPLTFILPEGLSIVDERIPDIEISVPGDDESNTIPASVAIGEDGRTLTITASYEDRQDLVSASTTASFTVPVTVTVGAVPGTYELGNGLTLHTSNPRNVKVTSFESGTPDPDSDIISYRVVVEAESDIDDGETSHPVTISDLTTGDSPALQFVSGSYTYAHKDGFEPPEGKPATQVEGVDAEPGAEKDLSALPLTISHMYEGDTITLTYTAKALSGTYDKDTKQAQIQNTVQLTTDNPSNNTEDDTASVTNTVPYTPLTREYITLNGSWAYWKVTVNPGGYTLNGGKALTLADTFDDDYPTKKTKTDAAQSIDYSSIEVTSSGNVTYDYSGNTGTYIIPDNTPVTIAYRTRVTAQPGEAKLFRGTAVLKDADDNPIGSSTAGVTKDAVAIYPSASDVEGFGDNFVVRLYVYADKAMQKGLEGVQFILLDADQRALEYKVGDNKGQPVTFTTDSNGYANIQLNEEEGDVSIEKNTGYYLEMMQAVEGYQKDNTLYSFMITDDPSYNSGGFYQYFNGDTMKVRLYPVDPEHGWLNVSIRFSGSYTMREDQQNNVTAVLQKLDEDTQDWVEVERHPYTETDSRWGSIAFDETLYDASLGEFQPIYRVVEENQTPWDLPEDINAITTYYSLVNTGSSDPHYEPQAFSVESATDNVSVVIDNRYEEPQLNIVKMDKLTGETLPGADFSVYKIINGEASGDAITTYTTDENGEVLIRGGEAYESETLYGIKETKAPTDYLLPLKAEWHYFYFCNDEYLEPTILANLPDDETATNLTEDAVRVTIDNQKEKIAVPVMKIWQGDAWPKSEVEVGLYQSVNGGEPEPVLNADNTPKTVTLTKAMPYNSTAFTNLPSRDEEKRNITYSIKEEKIDNEDPLAAGYVQEYGVSSAGVYIVRNKPATTLTVNKEWLDQNGERVTDAVTLAKQSSVTFDVYRSTTRFEDPTPVDGITNADMTAFVGNLTPVRKRLSFGAADNWSTTIRDLDKQNDVGTPYYYYVLEAIPSFGNEVYELDEGHGTVTIKNKVAPDTVGLTVTKAALENDPRVESLNSDFEFTLQLKVDDDHPVRSWQVYSNEGETLTTDWNGKATFKLKPTNPTQETPAASITLSLPVGVTATVTEAANPEYTVETSATTDGTTSDNGRSFSYETSGETESVTLTYTNTLRAVCKVVEDGTSQAQQQPFESLKSALKYIRENPSKFTDSWTIYLLEDYTIPATDEVNVQAGETLTITTASKSDTLFPFKHSGDDPERDFAIITRGEAGDSMIKNADTLTLEKICLDGGSNDDVSASGDGGLVNNTGILNLEDGATLRNSNASGKGGAVYSEGTVNITDGVAITGNSASSASAIYVKGTLNMSGGSITGNTGAADGAVVVERVRDVVNLSGNPIIFDNTNADGKAANLYIGVDNDNVVNVITPGLDADARIGISAMEGHVQIGEQFATAEFEQTANLGRFINDVYGYHGKLKDGTSTNIVWDGLTFTIKKTVDPIGANPNDRFTITLSSRSIVMSNYVIDGTLDYAVSAARQNRPGRITLKNVKANDTITISPLPVGDYTISETASNYDPGFTLVETGSSDTPVAIEDGKFTAESNETIAATNTRRLASVDLTKTLDDRLAGDAAVDFGFTAKLTEADGTAVDGFELASGISTDAGGVATFTMSPTDADDAVRSFMIPVGATMTITETVDPNYRIAASAQTKPSEGEGEVIANLNEDSDNVFEFQVTDSGADITFSNVRKLAEIELSKTLVGKVSKTESFTYTITLTNQNKTAVANYAVYRDDANPQNDVTTNEHGVAELTITFGENETETKSIPLTIPEGTKLVVTETEVKKTIGTEEKAIFNTKYSIDGTSSGTGLTATIAKVSDASRSIAFTNTRKTNTIIVENTVSGYSGNVVPFTYTATVTDGGENQNDYDDNDFEDGVMTFELTTGQTKTLTVPYGATLNISQGFIVGYETKVNGEVKDFAFHDFVVTNKTDAFVNTQLIGLQLVNNTSSTLKDVQVYVGYGDSMYRVNDEGDGQVKVQQTNARWATLSSIEPGKTAVLEIKHKDEVTFGQDYTVKGTGPAVGYYYTIVNEPSFHEFANPAILRVYDTQKFEVKGKLRYSVKDSIVTFTEQPVVSFDANGGMWTTQMEGYNDRDGDRQVYQKAVTTGEAVTAPSPEPVYPTAEGITFLGWSADETFAKASHVAGEDISAKAYAFDTPVTAPVTLYAVWTKPARHSRVVTVKNEHATALQVTATLMQNGNPIADYTLVDNIKTNASGKANFSLMARESKNLSIPDGTELTLALNGESLWASSEYMLTHSADNKTFTITSVNRDGTVTFISGICKITDGDGNLLYKADGNPAVYKTLSSAFTDYVGTLYTDATHATAAQQAAVKMLVDEYTIQEATPIEFPNKTMTLATAGKSDRDFPYVGVQDRSAIYRSADGANNNCFKLAEDNNKNSNITLTNIVLDGGSERGVKVASGKSGGLICIEAGTLSVREGTTIRNCIFNGYTSSSLGGAIYMTAGILNVNAGLFSNLHAYQGGAIYVKGGTLSVTGSSGSTRFENCRTEIGKDADGNAVGDGDGGAIYYNNKNNELTINGGTDQDNPGIIFESCVAQGSKGSGGAIYVTTSSAKAVTVSGCSFNECSARTTETGNASNGGGAICANNVSELNVSDCVFTTCDTLSRGGAIVVLVKKEGLVSISNSSFDRCNCKGQGGAVAVYQPGQEDQSPSGNADKTKLLTENSTFSNCSSGTDNGSGGAIQCYVPCMEFTNSTFTDCWAGKEGGAVNNYFAKNYIDKWSGSYMTMTGCKFTRCRAEDRYDVTSVIHYGGAVNTKAMTVNVSDSTFTDCVSTIQDGGALHLGGCGTGSSATISSSTFIGCTAKKHGGAVFSSAETLEVSGSTFSDCKSTGSSGGAVYHGFNSRTEKYIKETTKITDCTFRESCEAAQNGGAIWTSAKKAYIEKCKIDSSMADSGAAVYLSTTDYQTKLETVGGIRNVQTGQNTLTIPNPIGTIVGGSITNCAATNGSAVYVGNTATFSSRIVDGGTVTDSPLSITGNTVSAVNSGAIQTVDTGKLYFEGNVKVENNTCGTDSTYNHDVLMQIDGNTIINTTSNGLSSEASIGVYVSDPNDAYANHGKEDQPFGTYADGKGSDYLDAFFNDRDSELFGYQGANDKLIYWGIYVCKITDADGNTLKRANGRDAVYQRLSTALDEFAQVKTGTGETGKAVYVKMLVENYAIRQEEAISNFPTANLTLTTAGKSDDNHPYRGTQGTLCTISRTNTQEPLFNLETADAVFQLTDITLDGRTNKTTTEGNYKLITSTAGEIVVNSGTTLQFAKGDTGAAITGVQVTINGSYDEEKKEPTVKIINCTATGNGGAISTQNLTIANSSDNPGEYGTVFTNCTATRSGGAIYASGTTVSMDGASFSGCNSTDGGGALSHANNTAATTIQNCLFSIVHTGGAGGAVNSTAATLSVSSSSFYTCHAAQDGGAINHTGATDSTITATTFRGCQATANGSGGSVYTAAKTVAVEKDSFQNSSATNNGGALYCASRVDGSAATVSGTSFESCSVTNGNGCGGAIYSATKALTLQDYAAEGSTTKTSTTINACTAPGFSGAVHMATNGGVLNIKDNTVISSCYANMGGAIYLPANVTMKLTDSPEFTQNGYTTQNGSIVNATKGACIYLVEGSRINLSGSPRFSRNILTNKAGSDGVEADGRLVNGSIKDYPRQDIYLAGYRSTIDKDTNAASIYVVGELTGDTIWVWPEMSPHRLPNEQFAKIESGVTVTDDTLSHLRNSLADVVTGCEYGEYLAGVQLGTDARNVYWDKMYTIQFKKIDNKGVRVPGAGFTLYRYSDNTEVATAKSADGENDTDAQGKLLDRGVVEFNAVRIGAYYMKETKVPASFKENKATYLMLVGSPYLAPKDYNMDLWEGGGPLNVNDAETLVTRHTMDAGKYYGVFPLDANNKAVLRANLASNNVGIENIRNDYQASFMKVDGSGNALPGAAFTIYTAILDGDGQPDAFEDGYPKLMLWSRDGENYPAPVVSADGTASFKDKDNKTLPKGMVYFRELPLGTYYLLETAYPERNGNGRRTYYVEGDRVLKLKIDEVDPTTHAVEVTLSEWKQDGGYEPLSKDAQGRYVVPNQEAVCKLTDASDKLLYVQGHNVWDNKTVSSPRLLPAIYPTLEEGFETAQTGSFVYANGDEANVESELKLKALKDFTISRPVVYNSSRSITFTTAETKAAKDRYIFSTTRTSDTTRAQISRAYSEDTSTDANAGALITLDDGTNMTLQNIRLTGQKAKYNGRAIHVTEGSSLKILNNSRIENFSQTARADSTDPHNVQGGAILLDDNTSLRIDGGYSRSAIFSGNDVVNNRTDGASGSDGGAIAVGAECAFSITNAQFDSNTATGKAEKKGNGGAVSINKTKDAATMMNLPIYNVVFSNNSASYQGGAIRVAENCSLLVNNCTFKNNRANTFDSANYPGEGGAIAVLSEQDSPSTLTINGGSFTGNTATGSKGGAVKIGGFGTLTLAGSLTMSGNSAANGGAVTVAPGANVNMENGTISGNTATDNGGAFYVEANEDAAGALTVSRGSITGNKAGLGSAIYANNYAAATVTNASVTGNTGTATNGGAINVGGANAKLYFGGAPTVFDNFGVRGKNQQMNLVLSEDTNAVINTTPQGLVDGVIGVYAIESNNTIFEGHGLPGKPFGTFIDAEARANPHVFRNDHCLSLYGVKNEDDATDTTIYWVDVICKLTDANDKILYQDISLNINGKEQTRKGQAVYSRITEPGDDDLTLLRSGFNALRDGFDAAQGTLNVRNDTNYAYSAYPTSATTSIKLKMLKDYDLDKNIQYKNVNKAGSRMLTFTTAETDVRSTMRSGGDFFSFHSDRANADGKALIQRDLTNAAAAWNGELSGASMISHTGTHLTLTNIVLDGSGNSGYISNADGGFVNVASGIRLTIANGAVLQNSVTTGNGAGVFVEKGGVLGLTGNVSFGGAGATAEAIDDAVGNFATGVSLGADDTNGQLAYTRARQDIYLAGHADDGKALTSLELTGDLDNVPAGSIWVWAEGNDNTQTNHYYMLKQFAVLANTFTGTVSETTYQAFRNARADVDTDCGAEYFTGQDGDDIDGKRCVYWTGGYDVSFLKVDGYDKPLAGATFQLYKEYESEQTNTPYEKGGKLVTATSSDGKDATNFPDPDDSTKAQAEGTVLFSKIAPKTYYMIETSTPQGYEDGKVTIYKLTVNSNGTSKIERKLLSEEAYKVESDDLYQYHIMNISTSKRKVILRKVDEGTGVSLAGAQFRIYRVDGTEVINSDYDETKFYESGDSGVYFIDDLPYGTYRIDEVKEPTGYKKQSYTLTVSRDEVKVEPIP